MMDVIYDPRLLALALVLALVGIFALTWLVLVLWWRVRTTPHADVPCGMYGICQGRTDCADAHCEGHPRNSRKVVHLHRTSSAPRCAPEHKG